MASLEKNNDLGKYIFFGLLIVLGYFFFKVVEPFLTYMLLGAILSIALSPVHKRISKYLKSESIGGMITILLVLLIIIIPSFMIVGSVIKQTTGLLTNFDTSTITSINEYLVSKFGTEINIGPRINEFLLNTQKFILSSVLKIAGSITNIVIGLIMMFSVMYYLLIGGKDLVIKIERFLPFSRERQDKLAKRIKEVSFAVIYGEVSIALIQGTLGAIGFFIVGIDNAIFWGFIMMVLAFLPFVGSGIVWLPAGIMLIMEGNALGGVFIIIYGAIMIGGIDYYLRPRIISKGSKIHPLTAMIGVFGGLKFFGFTGILIGPMVAALFMTLFEFYHYDYLKDVHLSNKHKNK